MREMGVEGVGYAPLEVTADGLEGTVDTLRSTRDVLGWNVTIPHKRSIVPLLDRVEGVASDLGAVNTVIRRAPGSIGVDGCSEDGPVLVGRNTDVHGILRTFELYGVIPGEMVCHVLGSGGAAMAALHALHTSGVSTGSIIVHSRKDSPDLPSHLSDVQVVKPGIVRDGPGPLLVINATPVGMDPDEGDCLGGVDLVKGDILFDLVYNPSMTVGMARASEAGASVIPGYVMLACQGALSNSLWTSLEVGTLEGLMLSYLEDHLEVPLRARPISRGGGGKAEKTVTPGGD